MTIQAIGHRVLVQPEKVAKTSAGGIDLSALNTKMEANATTIGTILDVGSEAWCSYNRAAGSSPDRPWAKVGDKVSYAKYAGKWITDPDDPEGDYLMLNDEDVVAIIRKSDAIPIDA